MCYAVCENGDVWTWGEVRPDEMAPVGFKRPLIYTTGKEERYHSDALSVSCLPRRSFSPLVVTLSQGHAVSNGLQVSKGTVGWQ